MLRADELRCHVDGQRGAVRFACRIGQGVVEDLFRGDAGKRNPGVERVGVMPVSADGQRAVMPLNGRHRSACGIRIQRGGDAVIAGNAQPGIHGMQLICRSLRVAAVKDIAINRMPAGGIKLAQRVGRTGDAWGDEDAADAQPRHIAGEVQRVGSGVQIQSAEVDIDFAAQQRAAAERTAADNRRTITDRPAHRQPAQRQQRCDVEVQRHVMQRRVGIHHKRAAAAALSRR
ncbi:hypothetical protein D3C78_857380 [compost metagenome]